MPTATKLRSSSGSGSAESACNRSTWRKWGRMLNVLAIDPGPTESAIAVWDGAHLIDCDSLPNTELLHNLRVDQYATQRCLIEEIASYGMAVGKETFRTCYWYGRFAEAWESWQKEDKLEAELVERRVIKLHHCHSARATDANIRRALLDRFGEPGTKKEPNPITYRLKGHTWAAFSIAVWATDTASAERKSA